MKNYETFADNHQIQSKIIKKLFKNGKFLPFDQTPGKIQEISSDPVKPKVKQQIESRFLQSESNRNYRFPRKKDIPLNSNDSSIESLKHLTVYDLRDQNKKLLPARKNFSIILKNESKHKNEKFIQGKYKISKGSVIEGNNKNKSTNSFEALALNPQSTSYERNTSRNKIKNVNVSADLRGKIYQPIHSNPLYNLTRKNLAFKKTMTQFLPGDFFGNHNKKNTKDEINKQFPLNFLSINSFKLSLPGIQSINPSKPSHKKK